MARRISPTYLIALGVTLTLVSSGRTQPVVVTAPNAQAAAGEEVEVPIAFKGQPGIGALHVELVYDPAVLECRAVEKGPLLNANALLESNSSQPGRLIIGAVVLDGIQGEGILFKVRFLSRGLPGQKSSLRPDKVQAWDAKTHLDALTMAEPGEFTVAAAQKPPWLLPSPWLMAAVAGALLVGVSFITFRPRARARAD
jgi:Cohesin domain